MKTLVIPILQVMMAYHSGNVQQPAGVPVAYGREIRTAQPLQVKQTNPVEQRLKVAVARLKYARTAADYRQLEQGFTSSAKEQPENWLAHYYVAYCDARLAFLYQN